MMSKKLTPQETYDMGIEAYNLVAKYEYENKKSLALVISSAALLLAGIFKEQGADLVSKISPDVPNQQRADALKVPQQNIQMLNSVKADSVLVQSSAGNFTVVAVKDKKQEVQKTIATAEALPKTVHSPSAAIGGVLLMASPTLILASIAIYKVLRTVPLYRQIKETSNALVEQGLYLSSLDNSTDVTAKMNSFANQNELPVFVPPEPKKVLGLF